MQRYLDMQGVFRLTPDGRKCSSSIADCTYPNGLAFSPDEKVLYVNDTRLALIRAFDVNPDGSVGPGRLFHKLTGTEDGVADGMKGDVEGNVYCTGPGGVHVIAPDGKLLGAARGARRIAPTWRWGDDDWRSLYITTFTSVYRTRRENARRGGLVGSVRDEAGNSNGLPVRSRARSAASPGTAARMLFSAVDEGADPRFDPATRAGQRVRRYTNRVNGIAFGPNGELYAARKAGAA